MTEHSLDLSVIGRPGAERRFRWESSDALLYALAVGAGTRHLALVTENTTGVAQQVLPTFPVVLDTGAWSALDALGPLDWTALLHAEQSVVVPRPLPPAGAGVAVTTLTGAEDKGSAAIVRSRTVAHDETGAPLFELGSAVYLRGYGGWGGNGERSAPWAPPERAPDLEVREQTRPDQALLYRLTGDRNPLHSDPAFAAAAGFDRPILHGLCTFGFAGRALLEHYCGGDPSAFRSMSARFSRPVFPGDWLTIRGWTLEPGRAAFVVEAGGVVVLDRGLHTFHAPG
jgi:acyl dehydratase